MYLLAVEHYDWVRHEHEPWAEHRATERAVSVRGKTFSSLGIELALGSDGRKLEIDCTQHHDHTFLILRLRSTHISPPNLVCPSVHFFTVFTQMYSSPARKKQLQSIKAATLLLLQSNCTWNSLSGIVLHVHFLPNHGSASCVTVLYVVA